MTILAHATTSLPLHKPEPLQLAEAELTTIEALLIEAELRVATLKQQIAVFEQGYRRAGVGTRGLEAIATHLPREYTSIQSRLTAVKGGVSQAYGSLVRAS